MEIMDGRLVEFFHNTHGHIISIFCAVEPLDPSSIMLPSRQPKYNDMMCCISSLVYFNMVFVDEEELEVSMAEASTNPISTFKVTVKCCEGRCEKIASDLANRYLRKVKKHKLCCCMYGKEKKCDLKCVDTHKSEAYAKKEVDKNVCRDIFCKSHYETPIILPSSVDKLPRPPLLPPPNMRPYRSMYLPPPLLYGYNGYPTQGGYNVRW
ncbi:hypothetical protein L1887_04825 [Cichorium endivia]|nr:hypothetical protein L1887_04825 [Cichorium endivia]